MIEATRRGPWALVTGASGGIGRAVSDALQARGAAVTRLSRSKDGLDVTDEASANKAAAEIEELGGRLASISAQMAELPRPDAAELQKLAKQRRAEGMAFQERAAAQMEHGDTAIGVCESGK